MARLRNNSDTLNHLLKYVSPEPNSGCWLWTGKATPGGYGQLIIHGRSKYAHRRAFELLRGIIPDGMQIDHLCRVRCCVNPAHLEAVPQKVNIFRGECFSARNAVKTHCKHGHSLSGQNLWIYTRKTGATRRMCRECSRQSDAKRSQPRKAA